WNAAVLDTAQKSFQQGEIENGLRDRVFCPGFYLIFETSNFFIQIWYARIRPYADHKSCACADGVTAYVESSVEVMHDVHQADGINIKHRGSVGIAAHLRRITGDTDQITNAGSSRTQQVGLNA